MIWIILSKTHITIFELFARACNGNEAWPPAYAPYVAQWTLCSLEYFPTDSHSLLNSITSHLPLNGKNNSNKPCGYIMLLFCNGLKNEIYIFPSYSLQMEDLFPWMQQPCFKRGRLKAKWNSQREAFSLVTILLLVSETAALDHFCFKQYILL